MVKKSVGDYDPVKAAKSLSDKTFYTVRDVERLIKIAGVEPQLSVEDILNEIETAAHLYLFHFETQKKPTPKQLKKDLDRIWKASERLITALQLSEDEGRVAMPSVFRGGALQAFAALEAEKLNDEVSGEEYLYSTIGSIVKMREGVDSVYRLRDWVQKSSARESNKIERNNDRTTKIGISPQSNHIADEAINEWIWTLAGIWTSMFKLRLSASVDVAKGNAERVGGKFIKFVQACDKPLKLNLSGDSIRDRMRNHNRLPKN